MTIIAWDGKTLAADKRTNFGGVCVTTTKIFKLADGTLIGSAGVASHCRAVATWFEQGAKGSDWLEAWDVHALLILPDGLVIMFDNNPNRIRIEDPHAAVGSAMGIALAAMACGRSAVEAVELACRFDPACGNGIDALERGAS